MRERDERIREIQELLDKLKENGKLSNELTEEKENLKRKIDTDERLDECQKGLEKEIQGNDLKLQWADNEREKLEREL